MQTVNDSCVYPQQEYVAANDFSPPQVQQKTVPAELRLPVPVKENPHSPVFVQSNIQSAPPLNDFPPNGVVRMPRTLSAEPILDGPVINAGFSWQQAQDLNYRREKNRLELAKRWEEKNMDFQFQVSLEMWHRSFQSGITQPPFPGNSINCAMASPPAKTGQINFQKILHEFRCHFALVRDRDARHRDVFFFREPHTLRHNAITPKDLKRRCEQHIYAHISPEFDIPQTTMDRLIRQMLYAIPSVEDSGLRRLTEYEAPFANGIFNLATGLFQPCAMEQCFVRFPMEFPFNPDAPVPIAFETLLANMFNGDNAKMEHAYEELGALMSGVKTLKKLFAHQGVTNGGKTRLSAIYLSIIGSENVLVIDALSDITDEFIADNAGQYRVIFIEELPNKPISVIQATILKSFTSGTMLQHAPEFKILMCTNHRITTGSDGSLAPAMKSRIAVLPFASAMDETAPYFEDFEENFLAQEIPGIARKAMEAFSLVVRNGKRFTHNFPVNEVIETATVAVGLTPAEQERVDGILANPPSTLTPTHLSELIDRMFGLSEEINPNLPGEIIVQLLNEASPGIIADTASLGKRLRAHFGDTLHSDRNKAGKTCYNLKFRSVSDSSETIT